MFSVKKLFSKRASVVWDNLTMEPSLQGWKIAHHSNANCRLQSLASGKMQTEVQNTDYLQIGHMHQLILLSKLKESHKGWSHWVLARLVINR